MQPKIVDIHPHIVSTDEERYPIAPLAGNRSEWSKKRAVDFDEMITAMDEAGVDKAAIVHSSTTYGFDNSYVADCVAQKPGRVTGIFSVDMSADDAPETIRYWARERNLSGLRVYKGGTTNKQLTGLADPATFPGWECAAELGIPVCVSTRKDGLPDLMTLIRQFPQVRIIVDHMVEPPIAEGPPYTNSEFLFEMAQYDNVYLKMTTNNVRAALEVDSIADDFFPKLVSKFSASRIAWGSNYPSGKGSLKEMVALAKTALSSLSQEDQEWIFARTALSLYPVLAE